MQPSCRHACEGCSCINVFVHTIGYTGMCLVGANSPASHILGKRCCNTRKVGLQSPGSRPWNSAGALSASLRHTHHLPAHVQQYQPKCQALCDTCDWEKSTRERVYKCPKGTQIPEANNRACWGMPSMTPKALPGCGLGPLSGPQKKPQTPCTSHRKSRYRTHYTVSRHQPVRWGPRVGPPC